jgi:peroxiredoxin Q/BCP
VWRHSKAKKRQKEGRLEMVTEGDEAPGFELPRDGGEIVSLSQFKGSPVVLYFYPKDDTPGCTAQATGFSEPADAFAEAGAAVIGISPDSVKSHDKFRARHGLKVMLLADEQHAAIETYCVWTEKKMYGRAYMGVDRSTFLIGRDGRIERVWRGVKVPGHAAEVLEAVKAV